MKKELCAAGLLAVMLLAAMINIHFLGLLTGRVTAAAEQSADCAREGRWDEAEALAGEALRRWEQADTYTHIVLRHAAIEAATEALYEFLKEVYGREDGGIRGALAGVRAQMDSLYSIERLRPGSIF